MAHGSKAGERRTSAAGVALAATLAVGLAAATGGCASSAPAQWDGLERRPSKSLDQVYVRPGVQFGEYRRVRLDPAVVEFDKAWNPNAYQRDLSRQVRPEDVQEIKDGLAQLLQKTFAAELEKGGYQLAAENAPDVLRVTPSIVNLYVNAPDTMAAGRSRTYVMDAGRMTLVLEARDSVSGQLLARAVDTKQGTDFGQLQWANSVTNTVEAQRALQQWARALRAGLDRATGKAP